MREHRHASTIAGTERELAGDRHHFAGGNGVMDILSAPAAGYQSPTPAPQVGSAVPSASPGGAAVANTSGGATSLGRVQVGVVGLFVMAAVALVLMHKAGFKFSVVVG